MFGHCEYCGTKIAVNIDMEAKVGMVALCQCPEAFEAQVQEHRTKFQRKREVKTSIPDRLVTPRKMKRHRGR